MNEHDSPDLRSLATEPEDLDGHTIEELFEYLESDRTPTDPSIERSAGCRIALEALTRLRELTPDLLAADAASILRLGPPREHQALREPPPDLDFP